MTDSYVRHNTNSLFDLVDMANRGSINLKELSYFAGLSDPFKPTPKAQYFIDNKVLKDPAPMSVTEEIFRRHMSPLDVIKFLNYGNINSLRPEQILLLLGLNNATN